MTRLATEPLAPPVPDTGRMVICDTAWTARVLHEREKEECSKFDEVWEGVYVVSPLANFEHQYLVSLLLQPFTDVTQRSGGGFVLAGLNVSDRDEGWIQNYRIPDVLVILPGNRGHDRGTHWQGGPDLVVEILSPGDLAREKRAFYAAIGVRELLIVDRDPWAVELYRLTEGELRLLGASTLEQPETLASAVVPLSFRLVPGEKRPTIDVRTLDGTKSWSV